MKSEPGIRQRTLQEAPLSGRHVIESDDVVPCRQKAIDHVTADEASGTSNQNAQNNPPMESNTQDCGLCGNVVLLLRSSFTILTKLFAWFAVPGFSRYRLFEEVCRSAIRVPFNSKRLSRQT
jgi:hypothetical protein